jgi:hypothetical protein
MAGPTVPSVRITNIFVEGHVAPDTGQFDIVVTGPTGGPFNVAPGMSRVFPITPAITAIAAGTTNSGGTVQPATPADIG